jgi:hypothetical protein
VERLAMIPDPVIGGDGGTPWPACWPSAVAVAAGARSVAAITDMKQAITPH